MTHAGWDGALEAEKHGCLVTDDLKLQLNTNQPDTMKHASQGILEWFPVCFSQGPPLSLNFLLN